MTNLNLGCGHTNFGKDWTHIDNITGPRIQYHNITKLPFRDNSIDVIYSSHTLEYFDREEVIPVLNEWNRVLKVGGRIFISVPDFRTMAKLYTEDDIPLHKLLGPLYGKMDSDGKQIYHKTVWDYASLGEYLRITGFRRIDKWDKIIMTDEEGLEQVLDTQDDCSNAKINGIPISLNLRAEKNNYEGKREDNLI